jgi:NADH-quinone oxidoreductase subunit N
MAIPQKNIKRLLAYSGIAHIGYLLIGLAAMSVGGVGMTLFYLVAYLFGNMGAFFVVQAVADSEGSDDIDVYKGLARRSPALALALLIFLLSLGGIPFMAGFWAKLFIFWAVVQNGMYWLAFLALWRLSWRSTTTWLWPAGCTSTRRQSPVGFACRCPS